MAPVNQEWLTHPYDDSESVSQGRRLVLQKQSLVIQRDPDNVLNSSNL